MYQNKHIYKIYRYVKNKKQKKNCTSQYNVIKILEKSHEWLGFEFIQVLKLIC